MKICIMISLIFLASMSCGSEGEKQPVVTNPDTGDKMEQEQDSLRYLALGDSYTIGQSVEINQRYPVQIKDSLERKGYSMEDPRIIAVTGWTTSDLQSGIKAANPQGPFDLVSLLIGV